MAASEDALAGLALTTIVVAMPGRGPDLKIIAVADQSALVAASARFVEVPFGLVVWDSARVMAAALAAGAIEVAGQRVLELGCGTGLAGIAAARVGGVVTQTDCEPAALALTQRNAAANGVATQVALLDWRARVGRERYDVILGADVLYDHDTHGALAEVFAERLSPGGIVWLTDPRRPRTAGFWADLMARGWGVTRREWPIARDDGTAGVIDVVAVRRDEA